uniref:Uncharacterized protein n=1 Tax=Nelumbo nucifera TaxID=4432 RepID=A0A822XQR8_NELNU|nr:TPA_asm: hypothetical protein HUJ06_025417 [Nelumbo nucifera]
MVQGMVDYKGCRVSRSKSGSWRSASFIICEFFSKLIFFFGLLNC